MSACIHCGDPLDDVVEVHASGRYRCKHGGSWAEAWTPDALDAQVQEAYRDGYDEGYHDAEHEWESKVDDAYDQIADLQQVIQRVRDLADIKLAKHGQCWNSIFGREIYLALNEDVPNDRR